MTSRITQTETAQGQTESRRRAIENLKADVALLEEVSEKLEGLRTKTAKNAIGDFVPKAKGAILGSIKATQRVLSIVEAGYPKVNLPNGWVEGFLEQDPRPYLKTTPRWAWPIAAVVGLMIFAAVEIPLALFTAPLEGIEEVEDVLKGIVVYIALPVALAWFCATVVKNWASKPYMRRNRESLEAAGFPPNATLFLKQAPLPEALASVEKAKGSLLFTTIRVIGPQKVFQEAVPSRVTIIGTSGRSDIFRIWSNQEEVMESAQAEVAELQ
ncbi:MAG: hypothetical protein Q7S62_02210 [bacterium]|nr:hypothetical protein [bacterium]